MEESPRQNYAAAAAPMRPEPEPLMRSEPEPEYVRSYADPWARTQDREAGVNILQYNEKTWKWENRRYIMQKLM